MTDRPIIPLGETVQGLGVVEAVGSLQGERYYWLFDGEVVSMMPADVVEGLYPSKEIFVFGSNEAGRHGKGAALYALRHYKAEYGVGEGPQGDSYAIPTKDGQLRPLSLEKIEGYVKRFIRYARRHPECSFRVTRVGCGLAGYSDQQIAPFFRTAPENCKLPEGWREL